MHIHFHTLPLTCNDFLSQRFRTECLPFKRVTYSNKSFDRKTHSNVNGNIRYKKEEEENNIIKLTAGMPRNAKELRICKVKETKKVERHILR